MEVVVGIISFFALWTNKVLRSGVVVEPSYDFVFEALNTFANVESLHFVLKLEYGLLRDAFSLGLNQPSGIVRMVANVRHVLGWNSQPQPHPLRLIVRNLHVVSRLLELG